MVSIPHVDQHILVTVDIVVFTVMKGDLKVLLIRRKNPPFKGMHAIPGGFVRDYEALHEAALRELREETGVRDIFLKKVTAYGEVKRDPRARIVTIVYLALINHEDFVLKATTDAMDAEWISLHDLPTLAFDHKKILDDMQKDLKFEIQTTNIASQLLAERFSLTDLQELYENVLGTPLDKRNFRKRIAALGILKPTKETRMEGAHRPALLYSFKDRTYKPLKDKIHVLV